MSITLPKFLLDEAVYLNMPIGPTFDPAQVRHEVQLRIQCNGGPPRAWIIDAEEGWMNSPAQIAAAPFGQLIDCIRAEAPGVGLLWYDAAATNGDADQMQVWWEHWQKFVPWPKLDGYCLNVYQPEAAADRAAKWARRAREIAWIKANRPRQSMRIFAAAMTRCFDSLRLRTTAEQGDDCAQAKLAGHDGWVVWFRDQHYWEFSRSPLSSDPAEQAEQVRYRTAFQLEMPPCPGPFGSCIHGPDWIDMNNARVRAAIRRAG